MPELPSRLLFLAPKKLQNGAGKRHNISQTNFVAIQIYFTLYLTILKA